MKTGRGDISVNLAPSDVDGNSSSPDVTAVNTLPLKDKRVLGPNFGGELLGKGKKEPKTEVLSDKPYWPDRGALFVSKGDRVPSSYTTVSSLANGWTVVAVLYGASPCGVVEGRTC